jgi:hypothetical protein
VRLWRAGWQALRGKSVATARAAGAPEASR